MSQATTGHLARIFVDNQDALLEGWLNSMLSRLVRRDKNAEAELRQQAARFIPLMLKALDKASGQAASALTTGGPSIVAGTPVASS